MPSLHTNIFITFVLRLFLLLFVAPLVAFSSHTDKLRLEFRQDIHQISLAVDHLIDVFIDFRRFVQGSSDQRDALFLEDLFHIGMFQGSESSRSAHHSACAMRTGIERFRISFTSNNESGRTHRSRHYT
jgi:hypothetical protein